MVWLGPSLNNLSVGSTNDIKERPVYVIDDSPRRDMLLP